MNAQTKTILQHKADVSANELAKNNHEGEEKMIIAVWRSSNGDFYIEQSFGK